MRALFLTSLVLCLAASAWAQPLEGPFTVVEADSGFSISSPRLAAHGDTVEIFYVAAGSGVKQVRHVAYSLSTHQTLGVPVVVCQDQGGNPRVINAEAKPDGKWAAVIEIWRGDGDMLRCAVGDATDHRESFVAQGEIHFGEYYYYSRYLNDAHVCSVPGGGFIVAWLEQGMTGPPFYEYWGASHIAYVDTDSITSIQSVLPARMWMGPIHVRTAPISRDLTLAYLGSVLAVIPRAEEAYTDSGVGLLCNLELADFRLTQGGSILALHWNSYADRHVAVFEMDTLGNCAELGQSSSPTSPGAPAWNSGYGWLVPYATTCCVLIARLDTSGQEVQPVGVVHERESVWAIGDVGAVLTDDGRAVVAWSERDETGAGNARLRFSTVGWDTYLGTEDRNVILPPSSFSLSAFPNPFNSTLKIEYVLPQAGKVELSVFNVLGQKVETILNARAESGTHAVTWNPECAGGVYFVSMKTETAVRTAKVLYLR